MHEWVAWLLVTTVNQIYKDKEQAEQRKMQNVLLEEKGYTKKKG